MLGKNWRTGRRRPLALAAAAITIVALLSSVALSASAAPPDRGVLDITKSTDKATAVPGDTFHYAIGFDCSTVNCQDAQIVDTIPAAFDPLTVAPTVLISNSGESLNATYSWGGTNNRTLTVNFAQDIGTGVGLKAGGGGTVQITMSVPAGISPDWAYNGVPVQNTATITSSTADTETSSATVTVTVPVVPAVAVTNVWNPSSALFKVGGTTTVQLGIQNTSNALAKSLTLTVPDGSATTNPFDAFNFSNFAAFTSANFPAGADQVQVDAMIGGSWQLGTPASTPALPTIPGGYTAADITGLRIIFSSSTGNATLTAGGAAGAIGIVLSQRGSYRNSGSAIPPSGATVSDLVGGKVTLPSTSASTTRSASYTMTALTSSVSASKAFSPVRIPAGTSSVATITAKNTSTGPLDSLTITEPETPGTFFSPSTQFNGFASSGNVWPAGATAATLTWAVSGGTVPAPVTMAPGDPMPATPTVDSGQYISGFTITFAGPILGSTAAVPGTVAFKVFVPVTAVPTGSQSFSNTAGVDGSNDAGAAPHVSATGSLTVLAPAIALTLSKTVTPSLAVPSGGRSLVRLSAATSTDSGYVSPDAITITDVDGGSATDYWQAFDVSGIVVTQVPLGSTLTVSYTTDAGTTWTDFATTDAILLPKTYQGSVPTPPSGTIDGIRFVFANSSGFAQGTVVAPAMSFIARATLRGSGADTATVGNPVTYTNTAVAIGTGTVISPINPDITSDPATASDDAIVKQLPGGSGGQLMDKAWQIPSGGSSTTVVSQSGQSLTARLLWGTELPGYSKVTVSDPVSPSSTTYQSTVFETFDLASIPAVTTAIDPALAYDKVTVQLYNRTTDTWQDISTTTCTTANPCANGTPAYTLTATQMNTTIGVRFIVVPNDAARTGQTAPPVGSGVTSGPDERRIDLVFQLRNRLRDATAGTANPWITAGGTFNTPDAGAVSNTAGIDLTPASGPDFTGSASDTATIVDGVPALTTTKQVALGSIADNRTKGSSATIAVPNPGDVLDSNYPKTTFTVTASNAAVSKAWYLRVTDPMPCSTSSVGDCVHNSTGAPTFTTGSPGYSVNPYSGATYDPASNPFERSTLTQIKVLLPSGATAAGTTVTTWNADGTTATVALTTFAVSGGVYTQTSGLANVVGVSVLFGATDYSNGGSIASSATGTVTLETQLRKYLRSSPTTLVSPATITNSSFSQIYDNVLPDANRYDSKSASVTLVTGTIDVAASKSFADTSGGALSSLIEANRANDVVVKLAANSGTSTASSTQVVVEDSSSTFWNTVNLKSLASFAMPLGATQLVVEAKSDVDSNWYSASAITTAATSPTVTPLLPSTVTAAHVIGLRYTFSNPSGVNSPLFSAAAPAAAWTVSPSFTVNLRSNYRDTAGAVAFPSALSDSVSATSTHPVFGTASKSATATLSLTTGTFSVDISKTPSVSSSPAGEYIDWSMVFSNTGTGYLNNPVVVDSLPVDAGLAAGSPLLYDPTLVPSYTDSSGGILPTSGVTVAYNSSTRKVTFTWPAGSRLAPGEKYTIVLSLQLMPGLQATYGSVVNTMTFSSDRTLAGCTNTVSGNGRPVTLSNPACSTTNVVTTFAASGISTFKGVKGNVTGTSGAVNTTDATIPCVADSDGYYRSPCAAYTVVGGTDRWKLQVTNGGNVPATSAVIVDALPKNGDTFLKTSGSRGSAYAPTFAGNLQQDATSVAAGTTMSWEYTFTSNPCPAFASDPTCTTATWSASSGLSSSNYSKVTGIRITFSFSGGSMVPGAALAVTYDTVNTPTTTPSDGRAPVTASTTPQRAWNTFGVHATFGSGFLDRNVEPIKAGVQLATGSLQVNKVITGASAAYAPVSYTMNVACTVAGVSIPLPSSGALTVSSASTVPYSSRIDGIPIGADCLVTENANSGASSTAYSPAAAGGTSGEVSIGQQGGSTDVIPTAQQVTVTNSYGTTSLTITKAVTTDTTVGAFGPFTFSLSCTVNNGAQSLPVTLPSSASSFSLSGGDSKLVDTLPVRSVCLLAETDSGHASSITVSADGGSATSVAQGQTVSIPLSANVAHTALVTNHYQGGTLAVSKTVAGDTSYGSGPFTVAVTCTWYGQTLYSGSFTITGGQTVPLSTVFPVGTSCAVSETDPAGATLTSQTASSVLIPAPTGVQTVGRVTVGITNTFTDGTFTVSKAFTGAGKTLYGIGGTYTATVTCGWNNGTTALTIPLPASGVVTLSPSNSYTATVSGLIAGAHCSAVETAIGGATSHTVGTVAPATVPAGGSSAVTITNEFDTGSLVIVKQRAGTISAISRFGAGPFTVAVQCSYLSNGATVPIDLGSNATVTLSTANAYFATIPNLLVGASCTVNETDPGLAVSSALSPSSGTVTIVDSSAPSQATVAVINTFVAGQLHIDKTASTALVDGSSSYNYTLQVSNTGTVSARGVEVVDAIDSTLKVTSVSATGWSSCAVTGADPSGYGGTLDCLLGTDLAVSSSAPPIVYDVDVLDTIAQDSIYNAATVTSTNPIIDGDTSSDTVNVKWLDVTASTVCIKDAPYLDYTVVPHNLSVAGRTMTVTWADKTGTVVSTVPIALAHDGQIDGSMLFPGAAVDTNGVGTAWPGWRAALPGETPDWDGLVLDPSAYAYGLRDHPQVTFSINPHTTVTVNYPAASSSCEQSGPARQPDLTFSKTANSSLIGPGKTVTWTMKIGNQGLGSAGSVLLVDPIPSSLKITGVRPSTTASGPQWTGCTVYGQAANGYGGEISCSLDRPLNYGETTPDVLLDTVVSPTVAPGMIVNTARVTAVDPNLGSLPTLALEDSAMVLTAGHLAFTGADAVPAIAISLLLLLAGAILLMWRQILRNRRPRGGHWRA